MEEFMREVSDQFLHELETKRERLHDTARQEMETQYYWESENVQLERQERLHIAQDIRFEEIKKQHILDSARKEALAKLDGRVSVKEYPEGITGRSHWLRKSTRTILLDGKPVKKFKGKTETVVSLIKRNANPKDEVVCPNCGGRGTIESFMDGCDFCGSDFVVRNSKIKVSGFATIESVEELMREVLHSIIIAYLVSFFALFLFGWSSWIIDLAGHDPAAIMRYFELSEHMFRGVFRLFFLMFGTSIAYMFLNVKSHSVSYEGNSSVSIPNFSEEDMIQEIDHRLKSVLLAESEDQLLSFADCDVRDVMLAHKNVFDMCISQVKVKNVAFDEAYSTYLIDADVKVKLYRLKGKRVKEEYEVMHITLSKWAGVNTEREALLTEHQCPNCGHSINVFHGNICQFCKTTVDRHTLGWVFQKLSWEPAKNWYRVIPILYVALMIIVIL